TDASTTTDSACSCTAELTGLPYSHHGSGGADPGSWRRAVFVGLGKWGRRVVPRVARSFDIVAMVNKGGSESTAWHAERYWQIPLFTNLDNALYRRPVDAVFIATPTATHAALA